MKNEAVSSTLLGIKPNFMKNNLIIMIVLFLTIFILCGCTKENGKPNPRPSMINFDFIDRPWWESWPDKGTEINVKMDINSQFTGDAYLVLMVGKIYQPYTIIYTLDQATDKIISAEYVYHPHIAEGFKDSLKINGFNIRSYAFFNSSYYSSLEVLNSSLEAFAKNPVDYPVYFKKISVRKGKNIEIFKIIFPRELVSIPGGVTVKLGIGRLNDEVKRRFEENFPGQYELSESDIAHQKLYFETFPDSSKTSFVFSLLHLLDEISFFPEDPQKYTGKRYFSHWHIRLNQYYGAPKLEYEEYIYK